MTVFMQGCNFNCQNCHNPETMGLCNHCGDCIPGCEPGALSFDFSGEIQWDSESCTHCDDCLKICPISASPKITEYTSQELIEIIRGNVAFINGVTFSGGETTLQSRFLADFLHNLNNCDDLKHLDCMIDSNGFTTENNWQKLLPYVSGVMVDLKSWSDDIHKKITGQSVQPVLKTIMLLSKYNKLEEIRLLPIEGITDYDEHLDSIVSFIKNLPHETSIRLNAFTPHLSVKLNHPATTEADIKFLANQLTELGIYNLRLPAVYL